MPAWRYIPTVLVLALAGCMTSKTTEQAITPSAAAEPASAAVSTPPSTPSASVPAPPALSHAARIRNAIKPHIVYPPPLMQALGERNPAAEVQVRTMPNGRILELHLIKSSGVPSWDKAVLKAVKTAGAIPLDEQGQVPRVLVLSFRPK